MINLNINFQFGDFYSETSSNWWLDFLKVIIGAAIGSGTTLWAFYKNLENDKRNDRTKRIQLRKEKIKYFQSLIRSLSINLPVQLEFFKEYVETIKQNPKDLPLLSYLPLNELDRIVNKINQEDYYHAYLGEFGDTQEVIDEFRTIISTLDFFEANLSIIKASLQKSLDFDAERKRKFKDIDEDIKDKSVGLSINKEIKEREPKLHQFIDQFILDYHKNKQGQGHPTIEYDQENFIEKLQDGLIGYGETIPLAYSLLLQTKKASELYYSIQYHNNRIADDTEEWHKNMTEQIPEFMKNIQRLIKYNGS